MRRLTVVPLLLLAPLLHAQISPPRATEETDTAAIARILDEGLNRSRVMETLGALTDGCGPRLTGSPGFKHAVAWAESTLRAWGLSDVHREGWGPFGRGWSLTRYSACVRAPLPFPLISFPKAWSPGTDGTIDGTVIHLKGESADELSGYRGTLKGTFVLLGDAREIEPRWKPRASRISDSLLLILANADPAAPPAHPRGGPAGGRVRGFDPLFEYWKLSFVVNEGAAAILTPSGGDGGTVLVESASGVDRPDTPPAMRRKVYDEDPPRMIPQVTVAAEHYNRLLRMLERGVNVRMEMLLSVASTPPDSGYNLIGEIPGTDLRDEVVLIGAHLDSWHGGTGATDNATGVAACMEAMRILKATGLNARRTIRIGLWGGEEQGLLGSRAYVRAHLGDRPMLPDTGGVGPNVPGPLSLKGEAATFSVYFNIDNGTGRIRGVYLQGNEGARPIFRSWLAPFRSMGASTLTLTGTGRTDHVSFDAIGLPAFQFVQDNIEYFSTTWHTTMDLYERALPDDLKQNSALIASFAFNAAMREGKFPRKTGTGEQEQRP